MLRLDGDEEYIREAASAKSPGWEERASREQKGALGNCMLGARGKLAQDKSADAPRTVGLHGGFRTGLGREQTMKMD